MIEAAEELEGIIYGAVGRPDCAEDINVDQWQYESDPLTLQRWKRWIPYWTVVSLQANLAP